MLRGSSPRRAVRGSVAWEEALLEELGGGVPEAPWTGSSVGSGYGDEDGGWGTSSASTGTGSMVTAMEASPWGTGQAGVGTGREGGVTPTGPALSGGGTEGSRVRTTPLAALSRRQLAALENVDARERRGWRCMESELDALDAKTRAMQERSAAKENVAGMAATARAGGRSPATPPVELGWRLAKHQGSAPSRAGAFMRADRVVPLETAKTRRPDSVHRVPKPARKGTAIGGAGSRLAFTAARVESPDEVDVEASARAEEGGAPHPGHLEREPSCVSVWVEPELNPEPLSGTGLTPPAVSEEEFAARERARLLAMLQAGEKSAEPRVGTRPPHLPWTPIPLEVGLFSTEKSAAPLAPAQREAKHRKQQIEGPAPADQSRSSRMGLKRAKKKVSTKNKEAKVQEAKGEERDRHAASEEETLRGLALHLPAVAAALLAVGKIIFGARGGRQWKTAAGREWNGS